MKKNQFLLDIVQDRKRFIENDLCTLMRNIYSDIFKLEYSTSYRQRERIIIICRTETPYFHRRKYNVVDVTHKDIYEIMCLISNKIKKLHLINIK